MDTERDYFMSGHEAKEYGIVDEVVTVRDKSRKVNLTLGKGDKV